MRRQGLLIHAALLAVAGLVAAGPGSAGAADVIKFGVSTPLSGPAAPWGIPHKQATELIFDEINSQGGLEVGGKKYKLEVVAYDHKYVIAEGVATVNRLIAKDGVKFISDPGWRRGQGQRGGGQRGARPEPAAGLRRRAGEPEEPATRSTASRPRRRPAPSGSGSSRTIPGIKRVATISPNDDTGWWSIKVETAYVAEARATRWWRRSSSSAA